MYFIIHNIQNLTGKGLDFTLIVLIGILLSIIHVALHKMHQGIKLQQRKGPEIQCAQ